MIKAIIVDMDGTFLDDKKQYDEKRFLALYDRMKVLGIKFVVASGNQYQHLESFFHTLHQELTFIAENGAKVIHQGQIVFTTPIPEEATNQVLSLLETDPIFSGYKLVVSGEKGAYISKTAPADYRKKAEFFYRDLIEVDSYGDIKDTFYKFAFNFEPAVLAICEARLNTYFDGRLKALTSGHEAIDLVNSRSGKELGLQVLLDLWGIASDEVAAFGDNLNDLAMLQHVAYGYAVANARPEVKEIAYKVIGTNNQGAVLDEIDQILDNVEKQLRRVEHV